MKRVSIVAGIVVVVLLLVSAAFFGARMLTGSDESANSAGAGVRIMEFVTDDGSGPVSLRIIVEPASELPDRPAETGGVFLRRQDNSIFVGTGNIEADIEIETGKDPVIKLTSDGPEVEIVVTRDTILYLDETDDAYRGDSRPQESGEVRVQQVIKPIDSLDGLGPNCELRAWGERRGDRVVAEVVVYREEKAF